MLDLRRLRLLREVDARGTVHGAARALAYTPSAISQQLAVLEAAEAGLAALGAGRPAGVVRVASFQSAFLRVVEPAVAALADSHPDVRVEATEAEVEEAVPALRLRGLDLVVGDEYEGQPRAVHADLLREPLVREQVRLVLPEDHPQAARERVAM